MRWQPGKRWALSESVWGPRAGWCDSHAFFDTDSTERQMFECDWERALAHGIARYIERVDDDDGDENAEVEDGDEAFDRPEPEEVAEVLWRFRNVVYSAFAFYASQGSSSDVTQMTLNSFIGFTRDCQITTKKSPFCTPSHLCTVFIEVNASNIRALKPGETPAEKLAERPPRSGRDLVAAERPQQERERVNQSAKPSGGTSRPQQEKHNHMRGINRQEWLQLLVKLACMRYILPGKLRDVSDAVHRLLRVDVEPRIAPGVLESGNTFRYYHLYTRGVDAVLSRFEPSLRRLFRLLARRGSMLQVPKAVAQEGGVRTSQVMMSYEAWAESIRCFGLQGSDITERHVTLAFVWARMKVVDEQADRSRAKLTHLAFEDWLEALCRIAAYKALPTDDELAAAPISPKCAGLYLRRMRLETPVDRKSVV